MGKEDNIRIPVILLNYPLALIVGLIMLNDLSLFYDFIYRSWLPLAALMGALFVGGFFLLSWSSAKSGIAITSVSSKISVVLPMLFSVWYDPHDFLNGWKLFSLLLSVLSIGLILFSKRSLAQKNNVNWLLPLIVFICIGLIDSLLKFVQHMFLDTELTGSFIVTTYFFSSFIAGLVFLLHRNVSIKILRNGRVWLYGILLGLLNWASLYCIIGALNSQKAPGVFVDGSVVFGINNLSVVSLTALMGVFFFKEKLFFLNWIGIFLAIATIFILNFLA